MTINLLVTDKNLNIVGDLLDGWTSLSCERRFNEPATGTVTLPARSEYLQTLQPGRRLVVMRDGDIWCAGPMEEPQRSKRSAEDDPRTGTVDVQFTDDLARIAGYLTYPNPAVAASSQTTSSDTAYQLTSVNAEVIIRTLVNVNCGPGALADRRIEQLDLDALAGVGTVTSITTRFEPLLDACRTVAAKDGLGFRTRHDMTTNKILFGVYKPVDRTLSARFSYELGNLRSDEYALSAPAATHEIVMGGDEGSRQYVEVADGISATGWWRSEKLVEQSGTTNANGELTQAGNAALAEDRPQAFLATETVDTEDLRAGIDFDLGDLVSVVPYPGAVVTDVVRAIRLEATPGEGEKVTTTVGTADATTTLRMYRQIQDLARRVGRQETRR